MSPPTRVGPQLGNRGPDNERVAADAPSRPILRAAGDTAEVVRYLRALVGRCDSEIPVIGDLRADQLGTPVGTATIARAALAWMLDGAPEVLETRLRAELAEADGLAVWRTRAAWAEFEGSVREFRHGREHMVSFAELARRRGGAS